MVRSSQVPSRIGVIAVVTLLAVTGTAAATNTTPTNESAPPWAADTDPCLSPTAYETAYGSAPTVLQQTATCTDLTYAAPPAAPATWTATTFPQLTPGNATTSVYPPHANRTSTPLIADGHATLFAVHPSTRVHLKPGAPRQYIAPHGTVRALVDYRLRDDLRLGPNRSVLDHEVAAVRLYIDDDRVAATSGSQTPTLPYDTDTVGPQSLRVEADITVTVGNRSRDTATARTVTLRDTTTVYVYALATDGYRATYPDGDSAVAFYQALPWHGVTIGPTNQSRVRGVWRYYMARDTRWESLRVGTATGTHRRAPATQPAYVNAFPARIGPRTEPISDGPTLTAVWGVETDTPRATLPANVSVGVVADAYTRSSGLAVRHNTTAGSTVRLHGVIHGVTADVDLDAATTRTIREPELTATITNSTASPATLHITLTDPVTGALIIPGRPPSRDPIGGGGDPGTLLVNGDPVTIDADGTTTVTLTESGLYTVRFEPTTWRRADPAYTAVQASARWHPLTTLDGWLQLAGQLLWLAVPFVAAWIAGRRLAAFLPPTTKP